MVTIAKNRCSALRTYREVEYAEMEFAYVLRDIIIYMENVVHIQVYRAFHNII